MATPVIRIINPDAPESRQQAAVTATKEARDSREKSPLELLYEASSLAHAEKLLRAEGVPEPPRPLCLGKLLVPFGQYENAPFHWLVANDVGYMKHIKHQIIKTENILIETSSNVPQVRLIDFGLSCFVKKGACYQIFFGTSAFSPPEWICHGRYRAGPTTVWQMGAVLFETLHGDVHFETNGFLRRRVRISETLSKNCRDFLERCFNKDRNQRPTLEQLSIHP